MYGLNRRVQQLERQSGLHEKFVSLPLPGQPGQVMRLPRSFAEWLAKKGREHASDSRYYNLTDEQWVEC